MAHGIQAQNTKPLLQALAQRVSSAKICIDTKTHSSINEGILAYVCFEKDDNEEVIITRYDEYMLKTKPVLDFYSSRNYFHEIDGTQKIQAITGQIEQILTV